VRGFKARQELLASRWYARGERDLSRGDSLRAVDEIRTALAYSREKDSYRLKLALALMQAGKMDEARAHLTNLWEQRPGDAAVNLQLARVMARLGDSQNAVRYYHGAIYGVWDGAPLENREATRFELAQYLLSKQQTATAQSELIALASELPPDAEQQARLGDLMMDAEEPERALSAYLLARKAGRKDAQADLGAARATFALRRYSEARDHARAAMAVDPNSEEAALLYKEAQRVLAADPYLKGLNPQARVERGQAIFAAASNRLKQCLATHSDPTLDELSAQQQSLRRVRTRTLRSDPDLLDAAVRWAYDVEKASEGICGAPTGMDATLLILARASGVH
jgi:tetratricopeptide (TPR) repeat protein